MDGHHLAPRNGSMLPICALLLVSTRPAAAQQATTLPRHSNTILASATVVTDRLGVAAMRPVSFEASRHGDATTVRPIDAAAARWKLVGRANAQVELKLTLPTELVNLRSPTSTALPIVFSSSAGRWRQDVDNPGDATAFDPGQGTIGRFSSAPAPTLYVWLGSTVLPTASTDPGTYRGTVTLTLFY